MKPPEPIDTTGPGEANVRQRVRIATGPPLPAEALAARNGTTAEAVPGEDRAGTRQSDRTVGREAIFDVQDLSVFYGSAEAVSGVTLQIHRNLITAIIGPSGCGKSTFLRSLNRMNDSIAGFKIAGKIRYHGHDIYDSASIASRCADGSAWSSSVRTRFRSRSTTTSHGRRATSR